jgi:hypothetical protein
MVPGTQTNPGDDVPVTPNPAPTNATWYHGSSKQFERFQLPKKYSPNEQLGFGIHFARDKAFAARYGKVIYRCRLHPARVLNTSAIHQVGSREHELAKEIYRGTRYKLQEHGGMFTLTLDVTSPKRGETLVRKYGYDAVFYEAKYGSPQLGGMRVTSKTEAMVMLDPTKIEILDSTVVE